MTTQIPAEQPFYAADGSFLGYVGVTATLMVDLIATQESGPPAPQDLSGRVFLQRILDADGATLLEIPGANGASGIANRVAFTLTEAASRELMPAEAAARDLTHVVGEVTIAGFDQIYAAPFALRRIRRSGPSTILQLQPNVGVVLVRYAGAPPLSLLEELIAAGDLAGDATHEDLVDWLQQPANAQGETALQQIADAAAAAAGPDGPIQAKVNAVIAPDGLIDVAAVEAVAAKVAIESVPGGSLHAAVAAGVGAVAGREGDALAAVAAREGQAVNPGGAIDLREDVALAGIIAEALARVGIVQATPGFDTLYPNAYATALPRGVMSGTIGGTAITGATVGTHPLTAVGGSITGVTANLVVTSPTAASIVIVNPGLGSGTAPPTWANPASANLPVGTTLTAVVAPRVATTGRYLALSADAQSLQLYQNDGSATPAAVAGVILPTAGAVLKPVWAGKVNGWPDTFFRRFDLTSQTFLSKDRWYQSFGTTGEGWTRVKGTLFDGYVLRRTPGYNTTTKSGPSIWLDEINVAEGESVTAYLLIADPAAAGGTVYGQYFFSTDSDFTSVGGLATMTNVAGNTNGIVASATPKWLRITATRPEGATRLNLTPYTVSGATSFDVLACWAFKGSAADGPDWPVIEGSYTSLRDAEITASLASMTAYMAANSITQALKDWMRAEAYTITSPLTYNALGRVVSPVNIVWPDLGAGVLTITYNVDGTVASMSATYVNGAVTKTVAQPTITYAQGQPSVIPAITVV